MNQPDNRRSFRVSESVYIQYDVLSDDEYREGIERRKLRLGMDTGAQSMLVDIDARLSQAMFLMNGESEHLGKIITLINDKINTVINQLPGFVKAKAELAKLPAQTCDVSADGIVFSVDTHIPAGSKLYVQFLLESDNRFVETFCNVVREVESPNDGKNGLPYGVAVEFDGMKPEQREILIQHMFNRESETLRMRRIELDSAED